MNTLPSIAVAPPPSKLPRRDLTGAPPPALEPLFDELRPFDEPIALAALEAIVARHPVSADELGDAIHIDGAAYVRTLVYGRANVEVLVMAWLPGQRSPIHDHAGSGCVVRVIAGAAREELYQRRGDGFVERTGERLLAPGGVTSSFDADIHTFGNACDAPASPRDILVTIHVYSPPLQPTQKYVEAPR